MKKSDELTRVEYSVIKQHSLQGADILSALSMFQDVVPLVKYHHERINGTGYPEGLKGDEIPFLARILSVTDSFDDMTSNRRYMSKLDIVHAKEQLMDGAGTQFDSEIVGIFLKEIIENTEVLMKEIENTYFIRE